MDDAKSYLTSTTPATEGLFKLLNQYGWQKMRAIVDMTKSTTRDEIEEHKSKYSSVDVAREVIAGSILQIAFVAIKEYGVPQEKPPLVLEFEEQINKLISASPKTRCKNFSLPAGFCVGRELGHLPIGLVIYAARNQYNHFYEDRLSVVNEVIFNYLNQLWPSPRNGLSFNLYDGKQFYAYSALAALGWTDTHKRLGYTAYAEDMAHLLRAEF